MAALFGVAPMAVAISADDSAQKAGAPDAKTGPANTEPAPRAPVRARLPNVAAPVVPLMLSAQPVGSRLE